MTRTEPDPGTDSPDDGVVRMIADIADVADLPVPDRVRTAVLASIRNRTADRQPLRPDQVAGECAPYAAQVAELDALLATLTPAQWRLPTVHGWDVAGLVGHLFTVDAWLAGALGVPVAPEAGSGDDIAERTAFTHQAFSGRPPGEVHRAWRGQATALLRHLNAQPDSLGRTVRFVGTSFRVAGALLDRAGETWTHSEDVRAALGLPPQPPRPSDVEALVTGAARILPAVWPARVGPGTGSVLLRLSGTAAADWELDLLNRSSRRLGTDQAPAGAVSAVVGIDTIEFCYLIGGRRTPAEVQHHGEGDPALVLQTLTAAAGFARL